MTLETASDRAGFLADFSIPVTGSACFDAIFDNEYVEFADITGTRPILQVPYVWPVTGLANGDGLTVDGADYTVIRIEKDGTGWCAIILELA